MRNGLRKARQSCRSRRQGRRGAPSEPEEERRKSREVVWQIEQIELEEFISLGTRSGIGPAAPWPSECHQTFSHSRIGMGAEQTAGTHPVVQYVPSGAKTQQRPARVPRAAVHGAQHNRSGTAFGTEMRAAVHRGAAVAGTGGLLGDRRRICEILQRSGTLSGIVFRNELSIF